MGHSTATNPADISLAKVRPYTIPDPAPGAIVAWQPSLNHRSAMISCQVSFAADANAANRWLTLEVAHGAARSIIGITDTAIVANDTLIIQFGVDLLNSEPAAGLYRMVSIPSGIYINSADFFRINVLNIQAGDQLSNTYTWQRQILAP